MNNQQQKQAIEWAIERLELCQEQAFQSCECEECQQCGKMPDECTGTDCAKTCQCSTCDHCGNEAAIAELRTILANQPPCAKSQVEPAAQRQGGHPEGRRERFQKWVIATKHPVFGFLDGRSLARSDDREGYADEYVQGLWVAFKEFAEQPKPVLVVLPEREMYTRYLSGVIPSNAAEVNSYKDGWNACLDAAAELNPQRLEQVQAADESSELDKAWGAKNGLECWGHEPTAKGLFEDGWQARAKLSGVKP